jgi:TetR/AcrR family transcriptional regulator, transcriptional repressor for nem operon
MQARSRSYDEDQVTEAAMQLFWRQGYHASSADDLVRATGLSRSSLYATWDDKRGLFLAALARYRAQETAGLLAALAAEGPFVDVLARIFDHTITAARAGDAVGCLMVNTAAAFGDTDPDVAAILRANVDDVLAALEVAIARAVAAGQISPNATPRALARFVFHQLTALKITAKVAQSRDLLDEAVAVALACVRGQG